MMYLSKEATIKNQSFKMQMLLSIDNDKKAPSGKIWAKNEFSRDQRADLTIFKPIFPENTFLYANQGIVSTMKDGDYAIYLDYVVLGELILINNPPENLDDYELKPNEVFIFTALQNQRTAFFKDPDEIFYSYGFDEEKCKKILIRVILILKMLKQD